MKKIPLIYIEDEKLSKFVEIDNREDIDELYIMDLDGIYNNRPNLDLYQKLSKRYKIWTDSGPRSIDDIMDIVLAGAYSIIVRKDNFKWKDIEKVFELVEIDLYIGLNVKEFSYLNWNNMWKGTVLYIENIEKINAEIMEIAENLSDNITLYILFSEGKVGDVRDRFDEKIEGVIYPLELNDE